MYVQGKKPWRQSKRYHIDYFSFSSWSFVISSLHFPVLLLILGNKCWSIFTLIPRILNKSNCTMYHPFCLRSHIIITFRTIMPQNALSDPFICGARCKTEVMLCTQMPNCSGKGSWESSPLQLRYLSMFVFPRDIMGSNKVFPLHFYMDLRKGRTFSMKKKVLEFYLEDWIIYRFI